jgi:hypothetical protein
MNKGVLAVPAFQNKYQPTFPGRHNPAQRLFVDRAGGFPIAFED